MNAQIAMRAAGLLMGSSFRACRMVVPITQQPELCRPFRTTTVQMGRRSAKIAMRKVTRPCRHHCVDALVAAPQSSQPGKSSIVSRWTASVQGKADAKKAKVYGRIGKKLIQL